MAEKQCKDCAYFSEGSPSDSKKGECRINPPCVLIFPSMSGSSPRPVTYFPVVPPDYWCGQYKSGKAGLA
jgi:hypothetical protein